MSQILGALAASLLLLALFPSHLSLGATLPAGSDAQSFILELVLTAILMFVILKVSSGAKERGITAGIVVGSVIALEALFAGADMWCLNESSTLISLVTHVDTVIQVNTCAMLDRMICST